MLSCRLNVCTRFFGARRPSLGCSIGCRRSRCSRGRSRLCHSVLLKARSIAGTQPRPKFSLQQTTTARGCGWRERRFWEDSDQRYPGRRSKGPAGHTAASTEPNSNFAEQAFYYLRGLTIAGTPRRPASGTPYASFGACDAIQREIISCRTSACAVILQIIINYDAERTFGRGVLVLARCGG
jgi:hypothetical protein